MPDDRLEAAHDWAAQDGERKGGRVSVVNEWKCVRFEVERETRRANPARGFWRFALSAGLT